MLCDKLEENLRHFGFEFTFSEDERKSNKEAACYGYRCYRIKSDGLPTLQRFLHIVQPAKWRDRFLSGALKSNFIKRREKVLKIEPDGEEVVYGLTTTTGNYVVWGLASANSAGQLQQRPEPQGGGIIKRDWWQVWPPGGSAAYAKENKTTELPWPPIEFVVASLDTAYTEKTINDPSAMTVWGVFSGDIVAQMVPVMPGVMQRTYVETSNKVILMDAWSDHMEIHALVNKVHKSCVKMKVDLLLIEDKAAGHSVAQELRRLFSGKGSYTVRLQRPIAGAGTTNNSKVARLYSVQNLFEEGMIYATEHTWAEAVISQCATFPNAQHDDLVDTTSSSLRFLRDSGMLVRGEERMREAEDTMQHRGRPPAPLYPA